MRKKIEDIELEEEILSLLEEKRTFLSIRDVYMRLKKKGIKRSPQVIKRHLLSLLEKQRITRKNG